MVYASTTAYLLTRFQTKFGSWSVEKRTGDVTSKRFVIDSIRL